MKRYAVFAVVASWLIGACAGAETLSLQQLEEKITDQWAHLQGFTCAVNLDAQFNANGIHVPASGSGQLAYRAGAGYGQARTDLAGQVTLTDAGDAIPQAASLFLDDTVIHGVTEFLFQRLGFRYNAASDVSGHDSLIPLLFATLSEQTNCKVLQGGRLGGAPVHAIDAQLREPEPDAFVPAERLRIYFDEATGMLLGVDVTGPDGARTLTLRFRNYQTDAEVTPSRVQLAIPEGTRMADLNKGESFTLWPNLEP